MTQGIRQTIAEMTGQDVGTCPWRAFQDPFVQRVISVVKWTGGEDGGSLHELYSEPSNKLVQGYALYRAIDARMRGKQLDLEREKSRRVKS